MVQGSYCKGRANGPLGSQGSIGSPTKGSPSVADSGADLSHSLSRSPSAAQHAHVHQGGQAAAPSARLDLQQALGGALSTEAAARGPGPRRLGSMGYAIGGIPTRHDSSPPHSNRLAATVQVKDIHGSSDTHAAPGAPLHSSNIFRVDVIWACRQQFSRSLCQGPCWTV